MPKHSVDLYMLWMVWQKLFRKCSGETKNRVRQNESIEIILCEKPESIQEVEVGGDVRSRARGSQEQVSDISGGSYRSNIPCFSFWFRLWALSLVSNTHLTSSIPLRDVKSNCARLSITGDSFELSVYRQIAKYIFWIDTVRLQTFSSLVIWSAIESSRL